MAGNTKQTTTSKAKSSGSTSASSKGSKQSGRKGSSKSTSAKETSAKTSTARGRKSARNAERDIQLMDGSTSNVKREAGNDNFLQEESVRTEILLIAVIVVGILLFISALGLGGSVGNVFSAFLFGLFGVLAYFVPFLLVGGTFFAVANRGNHLATSKLISGIVLLLMLCTFFELLLHGADVVGAARAYLYSYENKVGGGFFGGLFAYLFVTAFDLFGAYLLNLALLAVSVLLIVRKSALRRMKRSLRTGKKEMELNRRERENRYRMEREKERRHKEAMKNAPRSERTVSGVSFDTKIQTGAEDLPSDEITELTPESLNQNVSEISVNRVDLEGTSAGGASSAGSASSTGSDGISFISSGATTESLSSGATTESLSSGITNPEDVHELTAEDLTDPFSPLPVREDPSAASQDVSVVPRDSSLAPQDGGEDAFDSYETGLTGADLESSGVSGSSLGSSSFSEGTSDVTGMAGSMASVKTLPASESQKNTGRKKAYKFPTVDLLNPVPPKSGGSGGTSLQETADKLQLTLKNFGVNVTVTDISQGPAVTRYEVQPEMGVKVSKIVNLADDIKLNLAAADIRIEAPIPGKAAVGIEVPNREASMVSFRELMESREFKSNKSGIAFAAGKDIGGNVIVSDIAKMPHLLIAGATGSGKSVCINTIIMSILYKARPEDVKFIMIDPKVVELSVYNGIPHLLQPVVTDPKKAAGALNWAVMEMTDRYKKFADEGVRDMKGYNEKVKNGSVTRQVDGGEIEVVKEKMPQIVVIVDELADLMMVASSEVEESICRLAQLARAAGIHLVIATQRPSVNVITGLIKANMPSRIAFSVTSGVDSRTILDMVGAEKLLGKGDMLYYPQGFTKPLRVQGAFVSDGEVAKVVDFLKNNNEEVVYDENITSQMEQAAVSGGGGGTPSGGGGFEEERDAFFADAGRFIIEKDKASIGMLQRNFKIGFNRAARIMDQLHAYGVVGPEEGTKPRQILMTMDEFSQKLSNE